MNIMEQETKQCTKCKRELPANKDFYFILSAADTVKKNLTPAVEGLRGFTRDCLEGTKEKGIIYGTGAWQKGEIKDLPAYKQAYEMGKKC